MWQLLSSKHYFNIMSLALSPTERKQNIIHSARSLILSKPTHLVKAGRPKRVTATGNRSRARSWARAGSVHWKAPTEERRQYLCFPIGLVCCSVGDGGWLGRSHSWGEMRTAGERRLQRRGCGNVGSAGEDNLQRREVRAKSGWSQQPRMENQGGGPGWGTRVGQQAIAGHPDLEVDSATVHEYSHQQPMG